MNVKTTFVGGVNPFLAHPDQPTAVLPRRLIIATAAKIKKVLESGPATCEQIAEAIGATHKNTSNRLRQLVIAGHLLQTCRGSKVRKAFYSINPNPDPPSAKPPPPYTAKAGTKSRILALLAASDTPMSVSEIGNGIKASKVYTSRMLGRLFLDGLILKTFPTGKYVKWYMKRC